MVLTFFVSESPTVRHDHLRQESDLYLLRLWGSTRMYIATWMPGMSWWIGSSEKGMRIETTLSVMID